MRLPDSEERPSGAAQDAPRGGRDHPIAGAPQPRRPRIKDLPASLRPRERLLAEGAARLNDQELIALILGAGWGPETSLDLAGRLVASFPRLQDLAGAGSAALLDVKGIGHAKAAALQAALELGRRAYRTPVERGLPLTSPEAVYRHVRGRLAGVRREVFLALYLDTRGGLLREEEVSVGTLTSSLVHPREVFGPAVREGAASLVLVHNHPSGNPEPSREDRDVTRRLADVGRMVGIPVLDHLVVGDGRYVSLAESLQLGA